MKLLRCFSKNPDCKKYGAAISATEPYIVGRYVPSITCKRCGKTLKIPAAMYARQPELTSEDFKALAKVYGPQVLETHTRDFKGAGFKQHEASDLYDAGFRSTSELEALERD